MKRRAKLKEANETQYWLELLYQADYLNSQGYDSINADSIELIKLLASITKTAKTKNTQSSSP